MSDCQRPVWDVAFAQDMLGKILLVGVTYAKPEGDRLEQFYGEVVSVDSQKGIGLRLAGQRGGEFFDLPPDLRSVCPAPPGTYTLRETGEEVEDPDYTAMWTIHPRTN